MDPQTKNQTRYNFDEKDSSAINLGLFSNIFLALSKFSIGILTSSSALISDGINSASDTVYYIITKLFLKASSAPPDKEHPYGHRQMENITSIIVGTFILVTAILLFGSSLHGTYQILIQKEIQVLSPIYKLSLLIALANILLKFGLYIFTQKVYKRSRNEITKSLATDHLNDILTAGAAAIGIIATIYGQTWADPLAGAIVSIFIFYTGYSIIKNSSDRLMSTLPSPQLKDKVKTILKSNKKILEYSQIRVHTFGQYYVLTISIGLDKKLTIQEGDTVALKLEQDLHKSLKKLLAVHINYHSFKSQ